MAYPPEDGHLSKYTPGPTCVNFVRATNSANYYAKPPIVKQSKTEVEFVLRKRYCQAANGLFETPSISSVAAERPRYFSSADFSLLARAIIQMSQVRSISVIWSWFATR